MKKGIYFLIILIMGAMQNYAKFESRIAEDSLNFSNYESSGWINHINNFFWELFNFLGDLVEKISIIIVLLLFIAVGLYGFYLFISLITKWWEKTAKEMKTLSILIFKKLEKFLKFIWNFFVKIINFFKTKKLISVLLIFVIILANIWVNILSGNSRILKISRIGNWYVWVDLKNDRIISPWYFVYSPLKTSYFLSPTNNFDFEIVEVTANTSEDLGVIIDYRVGFKIIDEKRLDFYEKYGAKNIKLVSSDIVMPRLLEVVKWIIKWYSFKDISSKHSEIKNITITQANEVLTEIWIELQDINILDIRLPETYLKSKQDLLNAENELKLAEARLETQRKESERKILEAENEKQVQIIEAQGIAESNKIINSWDITPEMIEMKKLEIQDKKIEKWDGELPQTVWDNLDL